MSLLQDAARRAERYLAGLDDRPVFPSPEDERRLEAFLETPLPAPITPAGG